MRKSASVLSARDLGGLNRALILRAISDHGPLARAELARLTGVTRASIGSIVQGLLDDQVLEERDPVPGGQVGKPATPLWFAAGAGAVLAVELRSAGVRAAVADARGYMSDVQFQPFADHSSASEVVRTVERLAMKLAAQRTLIGVGIAVPGTTDLAGGEVAGSSQVAGAIGRGLVEAVSAATSLPTFVENDSRAQALAEQWFGLGRGVRTFTSVQTGEGLGVGLVLDGAVYRGEHGRAGELGHHTVDISGEKCVCGLRGCWETLATLAWLRQEARRMGLSRAAGVDCRRLSMRAAAGEASAAELLDRYGENLAIGLANLCQILGSRYFILHGDAVAGGETFRRAIEAAACRRSLRPVEVVLTRLDDRATLLGAVAVVLSELLHLAG